MSRAKLILCSVIGMIFLANMVRASSQPAREKLKNDFAYLVERLSRYTYIYQDCPVSGEIEELNRAKQFKRDLIRLANYGSYAQLATKLEETMEFVKEKLSLKQIMKRRRDSKVSENVVPSQRKFKKTSSKKPVPPSKERCPKIPSGPSRKNIKKSPSKDAFHKIKPKRANDGYKEGDGSPKDHAAPLKSFERENDKHVGGLQVNAHEPQALADYKDGDSSSEEREEHPPASIKPQYGQMHRLRQYLDKYGSSSDSLSDTTTSGSGTTTTLSSITSDDEDC